MASSVVCPLRLALARCGTLRRCLIPGVRVRVRPGISGWHASGSRTPLRLKKPDPTRSFLPPQALLAPSHRPDDGEAPARGCAALHQRVAVSPPSCVAPGASSSPRARRCRNRRCPPCPRGSRAPRADLGARALGQATLWVACRALAQGCIAVQVVLGCVPRHLPGGARRSKLREQTIEASHLFFASMQSALCAREL